MIDPEIYLPETKPNWDVDNERFFYEQVISEDIQDLEKNELYNLGMRWVVKTFNSANDVIQLKDKDSANIIVKGNLSAYYDSESSKESNKKERYSKIVYLTIPATIDLKFKDGKYKYTILITEREEKWYMINNSFAGGSNSTTLTLPFKNYHFNKYHQTYRKAKNMQFPMDYYSLIDNKVQSLLISLQLSIINEGLIKTDDDW
tara:strand:- start:3226 stop:3834 length:609 start_codon:yes stop_codon:yes gene_type:complete